MNEQDLILRKKIEKRERFDTILAYILLVILISAILVVLYLKFIRKEEIVEPEEYVPSYISLNELSASLNSSLLANRYLNEQATFTSNVSANSLQITYSKDDTNVNLNIPQIANELEIKIVEDNKEIIEEIYKEIASIVCVYYGNTQTSCKNALDNIDGNIQSDGIRFTSKDNTNYVYISIDKSINTDVEIIYNEVTKTDINNTNYKLNLEGITISNINIVKGNDLIVFSGAVKRVESASPNITLSVKLYDINDELKGENKYVFDEENFSGEESLFSLSFIYKTEDLNNIKSYSIEVIK